MTDIEPTDADRALSLAIFNMRTYTPDVLSTLIAAHTAAQVEQATAGLRADNTDCHNRLHAYKCKLAEAQQALEACASTGDTAIAEEMAERLRAERDRLLGALKAMISSPTYGNEPSDEAVRLAISAIEDVEHAMTAEARA